ncbi:MAG: GTPase HflX [Acidimicrobiales bacterium]|jgi:GTP-binding protein HflX
MTLIERSFVEKILLVGVALDGSSVDEVDEALVELALLVDTAGAQVVGKVIQRRDRPDPATFIGRGKADEIHELSEVLDVDTVVFDEELSPAQQRNLEAIFGRTAIDRTAVILDVFAQNAKTPEGRAQVELALLSYRLPRLRGKGKSLSQQVGRIGTRGPGETKLEEDRRRLQERISTLKRELNQLGSTRRLQRKSRAKSRVSNVVIVGYTNAGKSTLMNALTSAGVLAEDRLFATLDPRTRRLELDGGEAVLLTDTVGFIRKLPHQLIESFKSTLEIVTEADLLLHVVDGASERAEQQIEAVHEVLQEIGVPDIEEIMVFNKSDLGRPTEELVARFPHSVIVSGSTGAGIPQLLATMAHAVRRSTKVLEVIVPFDAGEVMAWMHREGEILSSRSDAEGIRMLVKFDRTSQGVFEKSFGEVVSIIGDYDGSGMEAGDHL